MASTPSASPAARADLDVAVAVALALALAPDLGPDPAFELDLDLDPRPDVDRDRDPDVDLDPDVDRDPDLDRDPARDRDSDGDHDPAAHRPRLAAVAIALLALACAGRSAAHPRAAEEIVRGYRYVSDRDLERAEIAFSHALEFDPDLPEALNGLGIVARTREDLDGALRRFERAVRIAPDFAEGHANLGEALLAKGRLDAAVHELERALAIDPDLADARQNLARALLRSGLSDAARRPAAWARARREYLHLLESEPGRAAAHHDLAYMDFVEGRFERAEASYRRAAELGPTSPEALHGLCISLVRLGRCEEGARACEACLAAAPSADACRKSLRGALACVER
jgi:tetratricopeptide (TPR) repeat protein